VSGDQLATSGPYSDATSGVRIPKTRLEQGVYVLVPSGYEKGIGVGGKWRVEAWCDAAFSVEVVK
jgi:hypothetical protein